MIVYDLEIIKSLPPKNTPSEPDIEYCDGWHDHANMGISVLCAYDYIDARYRVFCGDNLKDFDLLCRKRNCLVSFNGINFDNKVLAANQIMLPPDNCYDLLIETWKAAGLGPKFQHQTHAGYGLDDIAQINFGLKKSGNGALAPILWQRGNIGEVIDYCMNDVCLTKRLLDHVIVYGEIENPKIPGQKLRIRRPF